MGWIPLACRRAIGLSSWRCASPRQNRWVGPSIHLGGRFGIWIRQQDLAWPRNPPAGYRHHTPFFDGNTVMLDLAGRQLCDRRQRVYRDTVRGARLKLFPLPMSAKAGFALRATVASRLRWQVALNTRAVRCRSLACGPPALQASCLAHVLCPHSECRSRSRRSLDQPVERGISLRLKIERLHSEHRRREANHALGSTPRLSMNVHLGLVVANA